MIRGLVMKKGNIAETVLVTGQKYAYNFISEVLANHDIFPANHPPKYIPGVAHLFWSGRKVPPGTVDAETGEARQRKERRVSQ